MITNRDPGDETNYMDNVDWSKICQAIFRDKYICTESKGHTGRHRALLAGGILVPDGQKAYVAWENTGRDPLLYGEGPSDYKDED